MKQSIRNNSIETMAGNLRKELSQSHATAEIERMVKLTIGTVEIAEIKDVMKRRDLGLADIDQTKAIAKIKEAVNPGGIGSTDTNTDQEIETRLTTKEQKGKIKMIKVVRKELYASTLWKIDVTLVKIVGLAMMKN